LQRSRWTKRQVRWVYFSQEITLLVIARQQHGASGVAQMRQSIVSNATQIDFAARLWGSFRALLAGALDELKPLLGDNVNIVMQTIDLHVQRFFVQALQLDPRQLRQEAL